MIQCTYVQIHIQKNKFIREEIGEAIYSQLFKKCYTEEEINEYKKTRNLNEIFN